MEHTKPEPFTIHVPDTVLDDLQHRLRLARWPGTIPGSGWDYGADLSSIEQLIAYWQSGYDWRAQERALNRWAHSKATVDGHAIHFIHERGKGPRPLPLLIAHGWPGSFFEFMEVIGPLTDPAAHGGDPADAFDVVVPSLPGYAFSDPPQRRGVNIACMADWFAVLMRDVLGYERYGAQGGDWGSMIASRLGYAHPDAVAGVHLNMVGIAPHPANRGNLSPAEEAFLTAMRAWQREERGYQEIQGTKPQTLGFALNDSPVGLCAWIVEKFRTWSDCGGNPERVYTKDQLLTNVMLYWVTQTFHSASRIYYEERHHPWRLGRDEKVGVPTGIAAFPKEIAQAPREWAERAYNVQHWTDMPAGGHFAAMEQPALLVEDVRTFFRGLR